MSAGKGVPYIVSVVVTNGRGNSSKTDKLFFSEEDG